MDLKNIFEYLKLDSISKHITGLIETRIALTKLDIKQEAAKISAKAIAGILFAFLLFMILFFLSITVGAYINEIYESRYIGFAVITGFYAFVFLLMVIFKIPAIIRTRIEKALFSSSDDNLNED